MRYRKIDGNIKHKSERIKILLVLFIGSFILIENIAYHNPFYKPILLKSGDLFHKVINYFNYPVSIFSYYLTYLFGYAYLLTPILLIVFAVYLIQGLNKENIRKLLIIYWGIFNLLLFFYILSYFIKEKLYINHIPYYGKIIFIFIRYLKRLGGKIIIILFTVFSYFEFFLYAFKLSHKKFFNLLKTYSEIFLKKGRRINKYEITNKRKSILYNKKEKSNNIKNTEKQDLNTKESDKEYSDNRYSDKMYNGDIKTHNSFEDTNINKYRLNLDVSILKTYDFKLKSIKKLNSKESENRSNYTKDHSYLIINFLEKYKIKHHFYEKKEVARFSIYLFYINNFSDIQILKKNVDELEYKLYPLKLQLFVPFGEERLVGFAISKEIFVVYNFMEHFDSNLCKKDCTIFLGQKISGDPLFMDLPSFPHLLIAGTTGSGKSVFLNTLILSLLFQRSSNFTRLILIDPKKVEFEIYKNIPHIACEVLTETEDATTILKQLNEIMEERYKLLASKNVRNIKDYNKAFPENKLTYIIIIIDEFGDLILSDSTGTIKNYLIRLAQKARATGIHLVVATQRPSAKIIDGLIKANFPVRVAFKTSSKIDSRIVLDDNGAEMLLGKGDMIFSHPETGFIRLQAPFISTEEIIQLIERI